MALRDLPGLETLLVRPGDRVELGEPIARYTDDQPLKRLEARAQDRDREASRAQLVRTPVSGPVAEVQLREVRPEGLTVEVVLVERPKSSVEPQPVGETGANGRSKAPRAP